MDNQEHRPLCVVAEWYDPMPMMKRLFILKYYVETKQVELIETIGKNGSSRCFLKKSPVPGEIRFPDQLIKGSEFSLYARVFTVIDYADEYTREKVGGACVGDELCLTCISLEANGGKFGAVLSAMEEVCGPLLRLKLVKLNGPEAEELIASLATETHIDSSRVWSSGPALVAVFTKNKFTTEACRATKRRFDSPGSIVASTSQRLRSLLFERPLAITPTARFGSDCTCLIVKPHAVADGKAGAILAHIEDKLNFLTLTAASLLKLDRSAANEFLQAYETVLPDYQAHVTQLSTGYALVFEFHGPNAVQLLREACGPYDLDFARELRPDSIRAKFGTLDAVHNAVHCTDLPTDGASESQFFFSLLAGQLPPP